MARSFLILAALALSACASDFALTPCADECSAVDTYDTAYGDEDFVFGIDRDESLVPEVEDLETVGWRGIVVMDWAPVVDVISVDCCFDGECYPSDDWAVGLQDYDYRSTISGRCDMPDDVMWYTWVVR